jgi:hypothetical protein
MWRKTRKTQVKRNIAGVQAFNLNTRKFEFIVIAGRVCGRSGRQHLEQIVEHSNAAI